MYGFDVFVYGFGMPRPKSPDGKLPVTLRIPESVVKRYLAKGGDWRERMQAAVIATSGAAGKPADPEPIPKPQAAGKLAPKGRLVGFTPSGEPLYR